MASRAPVEAPDGVAARPNPPPARRTSASMVGLPRESRISRARIDWIWVVNLGPPCNNGTLAAPGTGSCQSLSANRMPGPLPPLFGGGHSQPFQGALGLHRPKPALETFHRPAQGDLSRCVEMAEE